MKDIFHIINATKDTAEIRIHGYLYDWTENSSLNVSKKLAEAAQKYDNLTIFLNCYGGSVFEGVAIFHMIRNLQINAEVIVEGLAASMGFVILQSAPVGKRIMLKGTMVMIHKISGGSYGSSAKMREAADMMDKLEKELIELIADRSGLSVQEVTDKYFVEGKDVWLTAEEAEELELVDEVRGGKIKKAPSKSQLKAGPEKAYNYYESQIKNSLNTNQMDKEKLAEMLGLPENATEEQIEAKIKENAENKKKVEETQVKTGETGDLTAEQKQIKELQDKIAKSEKEKAEALVESAITSGKIKASGKQALMKFALSDYESAKEHVASLNAVVKPTEVINLKNFKGSTEDRTTWDFDKWMKEDPDGLVKMEDEDPATYAKITNESED